MGSKIDKPFPMLETSCTLYFIKSVWSKNFKTPRFVSEKKESLPHLICSLAKDLSNNEFHFAMLVSLNAADDDDSIVVLFVSLASLQATKSTKTTRPHPFVSQLVSNTVNQTSNFGSHKHLVAYLVFIDL